MSKEKKNVVTGGDKAKERYKAVGKDKAKKEKECEVITIAAKDLDLLNCLSILITFGNKEEMEVFIQDYFDLFERRFLSVVPYKEQMNQRKYRVWVKLEEFQFMLGMMKSLNSLGKDGETVEGLEEEITTEDSGRDDGGEIPELRPTKVDELDSKKFGTDGHGNTNHALQEKHENGQIAASSSHAW
ncbi:Uncharacterized protein TCM_036327 [Theobroma cacao]|uniref:Uncharacterized protein n=1 Tax=Theobroma cacao TaxID=3641 RepID=A0A061FIP6_THECC|nr:Uncharacterized protein TCM_036327 [Theobroma cacao]